jgi:putative tricarboxylic transport membrane protein
VFSTVAALAMLWAAAFDPIPYEVVVAADPVVATSPDNVNESGDALADLTPEQAALMARDPDWSARASLYHAGGGGATGLGYVTSRKAADPHTIILVNGTTQITPILNPAAKTLSEVRPVMNVMLDDFLLFVKGDAPWKDAKDFVATAKSRPPKSLAFATGGTTDVMAVTIFAKTTGAEYNMLNFNSGGEALTQLLGGHVQACMGNPLEFMGHLQSKAVRALGVFRDTRFTALPDVPTMKEQGFNAPNFQMWRGMAMPKGAPDDAARYWEGVFAKVVASPTFKAYIAENIASEAPIPGAAFAKFLEDQEKLYRDLLGKPA